MKPVDLTAGISMDLLPGHEKFLTYDLDGKPIYLVRASAFEELKLEAARLAEELACERSLRVGYVVGRTWKRPRRW